MEYLQTLLYPRDTYTLVSAIKDAIKNKYIKRPVYNISYTKCFINIEIAPRPKTDSYRNIILRHGIHGLNAIG